MDSQLLGGDRFTVETSDDGVIAGEHVKGTPTWVLVHGFTAGPGDWLPVSRVLVQRGGGVVLMELRGHHRSRSGTGGFGIDRLARDVVEVADSLGLERLVLGGHSLGATVAVAAAAQLGQRVERLVVVGGTLRSARGLRRTGALVYGSRLGDFLIGVPRIGRAFMRAWFAPGADRVMVERQRRISASCPRATRVHMTRALSRIDIAPIAAQLEVPTTIVCGTKDRATPMSEAELLHATIAGSTLDEVQNAGHMVLVEQPAVVVSRLLLRA